MQPEPEHARTGIAWADPMLLSLVGMLVVGTLARVLVSNEPFDLKRLVGELLLSVLAAVALFYGGLLQGLDPMQMMLIGALSGLGGVRLVEWAIKLVKLAKEVT